MRAGRFVELLKPYLWLALAAFLTGFICYAGVGAPRAATQVEPPVGPLIAAPASSAWNLSKHI